MNYRLRINKKFFLPQLTLFLLLLPPQLSKVYKINSILIYNFISYLSYFLLFIMVLYIFSMKKYITNIEIKNMIKICLPFFILMLVVEFISLFFSPVVQIYGFKYWTRSLSVLINKCLIIITVVCFRALCGNQTIEKVTKVLLINQFFVIFFVTMNYGINNLFFTILHCITFQSGVVNNYEVHELTYCIGFCLLYYAGFEKLRTKKDVIRVIFLLFSFALGGKRIGYAAIFVSFVLSKLLYRKGLSKRALKFIGFSGILIVAIYLIIIYNNTFLNFLSGKGVGVMGRDLIYAYYTKRTVFDSSFLGWGIAGVSKTIENLPRTELQYMSNVKGLHNDILKMYINYGFVLFFIWVYLNLVTTTKKIFNYFGKKNANIYLVFCVYLFITYLTDNTESYFVCQVVFLLIPFSYTNSLKEVEVNAKKFNIENS